MGKEKEWVEIARKYIPDLTTEQEDFIVRLAKCPYYNGEFQKALLYDDRNWSSNNHLCSLDLLVAKHKLNNLASNPITN